MTNALKAPTAGTDPLATDVSQLANLFNALLDAGTLQLAAAQTTPAAPTAAASGSTGNLNGAYRWVTVLITGWKQGDGSYYVNGFVPSTDSTQVTVTNNSASLTSIATGGVVVIGRAIYRTAAGGAAGTEKFCGVIWDNGTTTFTDNVSDASLGSGMPSTNTTPAAYGTAIPANVPISNTTGTILLLARDPISDMEAATKHYVDANSIKNTGGTISGNLTVTGTTTLDGFLTINKSDPGIILEAQDSGHANEQVKLTHYGGTFQVQDVGTNGTWVKTVFSVARSDGSTTIYGPTTITNGSNFSLEASSGSNDAGDIVFVNGDGTIKSRIHSGTAAAGYVYFQTGGTDRAWVASDGSFTLQNGSLMAQSNQINSIGSQELALNFGNSGQPVTVYGPKLKTGDISGTNAGGSGLDIQTDAAMDVWMFRGASGIKFDHSTMDITCAGNKVWHNGNSGASLPAANSSAGYQKLASGLIIQWGFNNMNATSSLTVNFPTAFTSYVFSIVASGNTIGTANQYAIDAAYSSLTQFTLYNSQPTGQSAYWIAIGK